MTSGPRVSGSTVVHECSPASLRRHRVALDEVTDRMTRVLTVCEAGPEWRAGFDDAVRRLRAAFAEHRRMTEGPDGLYPEMLDAEPRLTRAVRGLLAEHRAVDDALDALGGCAEGPGDCHALRRRAAEVLRELDRHRQRGADLVYEAYATDLGGET